MCPDGSPPMLKPFARMCSSTYRSPTGVRTSSIPRPPRYRSRPRLDITVATTPGRCSRLSCFQLSALVDDQDTIRVTIERNADIGAHLADLCAKRAQVGRPAIFVDVEAVRIDADRDDVRTHFPQCPRSNAIGGAVGTVDDHTQAFERHGLGQGQLGELDVAILHAVDATSTAEVSALGELLAEVGLNQMLSSLLSHRS